MVSTIISNANPTRGDGSRVGEDDVRSGMPPLSMISKHDLSGVPRVEDVARSGMASLSSDPNRIGDLDLMRDDGL